MKNSKNNVEEFIRVDHAGERGAVKIYEGQLLALNTLVKDEKSNQLNFYPYGIYWVLVWVSVQLF